jgi:hypothetical protein
VKYVLALLFMSVLSASLWCQENPVEMKCWINANSSRGEFHFHATVTNNDTLDILIPLSHWDLDGEVDSTDYMVAYPWLEFIAHRLFFAPLGMEKIVYRGGDKGFFPLEYHYLPKFMRIKSGQTDSLRINVTGKIGRSLASGKYGYRFDLLYCTQKELDTLQKAFPEATRDKIEESSFVNVNIRKYREPARYKLSSVRVPKGKSDLIRRLLDRWIVSCGRRKFY